MRVRCPECDRIFDLMVEEDAEELAYGHDCEPPERCSECGDVLDLDGYDGLCGNCADRAETEGRWS